MAILELTITQSYVLQECINRFNYLASGTPAAVSFSFALVSAIGAIESGGNYPPGTLIQAMRAIQSTAVSYEEVSVKNVYSVTDFYSTPFVPALSGTVTGEAASPIIAMGFRTNRTRLDIRRATKRFVGGSEQQIASGGGYTGAFLTGPMNDMALALTDVLEYDDEGNTLTFAPIVVGKEKYTPDPLRPERVAYRYYPTEGEQMMHIMQSILWEPYDRVRSQVSRQFGRGR